MCVCALFEWLEYVTVSATTSWHCLYLYDSVNYAFILANCQHTGNKKMIFLIYCLYGLMYAVFFKLVVVFLESWVAVIPKPNLQDLSSQKSKKPSCFDRCKHTGD